MAAVVAEEVRPGQVGEEAHRGPGEQGPLARPSKPLQKLEELHKEETVI